MILLLKFPLGNLKMEQIKVGKATDIYIHTHTLMLRKQRSPLDCLRVGVALRGLGKGVESQTKRICDLSSPMEKGIKASFFFNTPLASRKWSGLKTSGFSK